MSSNHVDHFLPDGFGNIVRLFPLPSLVLFPGVVQALHLFEPRYQELAADALADDELITMALIRGESTEESGPNPELEQTVCVGKVLSHTQLDDGRYNMFLVGAKRARIVTELPQDTPYRMAEVEILEDVVTNSCDIAGLRKQIVDEFRCLAEMQSSWNHEALDSFLDNDLPFGHLVDMICYSCGAGPKDQLRVLETIELGRRGEIVLSLIKRQIELKRHESAAQQGFPPDFSLN